MKKFIVSVLVVMVVMTTAREICGAKVEIQSETTKVLVNPENKKDLRVLLYFDTNKIPSGEDTYIDFATLNIRAEVRGDISGTIEVLPVLTEWNTRGDLTWSNPWTKPGGDYGDQEKAGRYSLKSEYDEKEISIDISEIVRDWTSGIIGNNGIIVKLAEDDVSLSKVEYNMDLTEASIEVFFTKTAQEKNQD